MSTHNIPDQYKYKKKITRNCPNTIMSAAMEFFVRD